MSDRLRHANQELSQVFIVDIKCMEICFLKFEQGNLEYVWSTYVGAMKPHIEKIWGWENFWQEENFLKSFDIYSTYILTLNENKIGYIQFRHDKELIYLSMVVLEKSYQSKGIGPIVIDKIQAFHPGAPIKLRCFKVNLQAYNFYLRNGFDIVATDDEFYTLCRASANAQVN